MIIIISHRGFWEEEFEKNTIVAFNRSFSSGFGTETDIRDFQGELVISHNIANNKCIPLEEVFKLYSSFNQNLPLALNIKADGLQFKLKELIKKYGIVNYFVFDMSVPDGLIYLNNGFNTFTRQSEYEQNPPYYEKASGIWMDEFYEHWITDKLIESHLLQKKDVCIVSPELHGRNYEQEWYELKNLNITLPNNKIILCTDIPEKAKIYFNE